MNKLYKSYTLNIMTLLGLLGLVIFGKQLFKIFAQPYGGAGDFIAFFYIPASFTYIGLLITGIIVEYICMQSNIKFAFNFPYEKINSKVIYYPLFYIGLIWGIIPALYLITGLLFNI